MKYVAVQISVLILLLVGCTPSGEVKGITGTPPPISVVKEADSGISRLTLSDKAAERLGIETADVAPATIGGVSKTVIPYAAVIYDGQGKTWTYTNPEALVFVRAPITVERIDGDTTIVSSGPAAGTRVVTVGVPELWGAENGVGGGH
jgi:hypothetical protein